MSTTFDAGAWTTTGAFLVAPETYRIPLSMPNDGLRAVNVYLVVDGTHLALVDAGWSTERSFNELVTAINSIGRSIDDIATVMVTHVHHDHYSLAMRIRRETGCKVLLGRGEQGTLARVLQGPGRSLAEQRDRLALCGGVSELASLDRMVGADDPRAWVTDEFEEPDQWLENGDHVHVGSRTLTAVETPGHTRGHMCFLDEQLGLAFTGDHVLPHITPSIGFEAVTNPQGLDDYLRSLRLSTSWIQHELMPAHGPAGGSVSQRADDLIRHHEHRLVEMTEMVAPGDHIHDVARKVGWTGRRRAFTELDDFNQIMACLETLAHVEVLAQRGAVTVKNVDGTLRVQRAQ